MAGLSEVIEREREWLRGFRATAEMSDHSMGEMLRSYAVSLLDQKVIYDLYTMKDDDGKPVTSEQDKISWLTSYLIIPKNTLLKVPQYIQNIQETNKMKGSIKGKIASADAPRLFNLIRQLQTQSLKEVNSNREKAKFPMPTRIYPFNYKIEKK